MKAIIFDMDGVLINSQPLHFEAEKRAIAHFGYNITYEELKFYLGWNEEAFWKHVKARYMISATIEELKSVERPMLEELLKKELKPNKNLQELLERLKSKGLKLAVASSAPKKWVIMTLEGLGITKFFDAAVSGEEVKKSKPAPDIFLAAARQIGIDPKNCAVIEDAPDGITAANAAGIYSIVIKNKINEGLDFSHAKEEITNLNQILSKLEK